MLLAALGGLVDRTLVRTLHWPLSAHRVWQQFLSHPSWAAVTALLISPGLEELGFRAFLSTAPKFVFTGLTVLPGFIYMLIASGFVPMTAPRSPVEVLTRFLHSFWVILPAGAISLLLYRYRREAILAFFRRRAGWVFWTSCILFGAGHGLLYNNTAVWWAFVLVIPQFLAGVGLGYVRASFGLRWSVAGHYAMDTLLVLPSWVYLSVAHSGSRYGVFLTVTMVDLAILVYGVVVLRRVAQFRC